MSTTTTLYAITKPTVGGDAGVWGTPVNAGFDIIDQEIGRGRIPFISPTYNVAGTTTLDLNQTTGARVFVFTVSGASTLAFSNVPSASFACRVRLLITNGGAFALTFPASVSWLSRVPTLKTAGVDEVELVTKDGGTTWYAAVRGAISGVLFTDVAKSTTSTTEVSITSFTLPAALLTVNGQQLRITVCGTKTGGGSARLRVKFGATYVQNVTPLANVATGNAYRSLVHVVRTGATSQLAHGLHVDGTTNSLHEQTSPGETLSGTVLVDIRGFVDTAGTLNVHQALIEWLGV